MLSRPAFTFPTSVASSLFSGVVFACALACGLVFGFIVSPSVAAQATAQPTAQPTAQSAAQATAQPAAQTTCPDLTPLLADPDPDWQAVEQQLAFLAPRCLRSADYFALQGAAQMHNGRLTEALESLERALLLQPQHGGAQIDYAQALYLQGHLFTALELNRHTLARPDLPADLRSMLDEREDDWRSLTRQRGFNVDVLAGYDNNLNSAPAPDQITLTLTGESIILPLGPDYRPVSGPYLNLHAGARFRQLAPHHQHNVMVQARGRVSEHSDSDMLQLDTRYAFVRPGRDRAWQANAGMSHLFFGGNPLYSATELGARFMPAAANNTCRPYATGVAQHQLFHNQSQLNAIESKLGGGLSCLVQTRIGRQQWVPEMSVLHNTPVRGGRAGGERQGWQATVEWSLELPTGMLTTHLNHTRMTDGRGYNPVLSDNARRWMRRSYLLLQYRQPLLADTMFMVNVFHQKQQSNLNLFRSDDTSVELGFSYVF